MFTHFNIKIKRCHFSAHPHKQQFYAELSILSHTVLENTLLHIASYAYNDKISGIRDLIPSHLHFWDFL